MGPAGQVSVCLGSQLCCQNSFWGATTYGERDKIGLLGGADQPTQREKSGHGPMICVGNLFSHRMAENKNYKLNVTDKSSNPGLKPLQFLAQAYGGSLHQAWKLIILNLTFITEKKHWSSSLLKPLIIKDSCYKLSIHLSLEYSIFFSIYVNSMILSAQNIC